MFGSEIIYHYITAEDFRDIDPVNFLIILISFKQLNENEIDLLCKFL